MSTSEDGTTFFNNAHNVKCFLESDRSEIKVLYDEQILPNSAVSRMIAQFGHVYEQCSLAASSTLIIDLSIVKPTNLITIRERNSEVPEKVMSTLPQLFTFITKLNTHKLAVDVFDGTFTYGEVEHLSTKLASALLCKGYKPRTRVLYCMDKSKYAPIRMLALLKIGAVIVPADSAHPYERIREVANVCSCSIVLTSSKNRSLFDGSDSSKIDISDIVGVDLRDHFAQLPAVSPDDEAFIFCTSGSTGTSKAILQRHSMLSTSLLHQVKSWNLQEGSRVLQFASYAFDQCLVETFGAFFSASCLCVPSDAGSMSDLQEYLRIARSILVCLSNTVARLLDPPKFPSLSLTLMGGERLAQDLFLVGPFIRR